jgi:hypothetical protein
MELAEQLALRQDGAPGWLAEMTKRSLSDTSCADAPAHGSPEDHKITFRCSVA